MLCGTFEQIHRDGARVETNECAPGFMSYYSLVFGYSSALSLTGLL
jgi:hypothetical protein